MNWSFANIHKSLFSTRTSRLSEPCLGRKQRVNTASSRPSASASRRSRIIATLLCHQRPPHYPPRQHQTHLRSRVIGMPRLSASVHRMAPPSMLSMSCASKASRLGSPSPQRPLYLLAPPRVTRSTLLAASSHSRGDSASMSGDRVELRRERARGQRTTLSELSSGYSKILIIIPRRRVSLNV